MKNRIFEGFIIFAIYSVLTVILTYPVIFNISESIMGPSSDNLNHIWILWWLKKSIFELHTNPFFTKFMYFPGGVTLLFHNMSIITCFLWLY